MVRPRDLGAVDGALFSVGLGINNRTKIVGGSLASSDAFEPMSWTKRLGMNLIGIVAGTVYSQA